MTQWGMHASLDASAALGRQRESPLPIQPLPAHLIPMLSSISSFLPSALQIGSEKPSSQPHDHQPLSESPTKADTEEDMTVDEHGAKKKKERTNEVRSSMTPVHPVSSFFHVLVRPAPARFGSSAVTCCNWA